MKNLRNCGVVLSLSDRPLDVAVQVSGSPAFLLVPFSILIQAYSPSSKLCKESNATLYFNCTYDRMENSTIDVCN